MSPSINTPDASLSGGSSERVPLSRVEILVIVAFWALIAILAAANGALDPRGRAAGASLLSPSVVLGFLQAAIWAVLTPFIFALVSRTNIDRSNVVMRLVTLAAVGIVTAILVDGTLAWLRFDVLGFRPGGAFRPPPRAFDPIFGVARLFFLDDLTVYSAVLAAAFARDYLWRYRNRREEALRLQAHAVELEAQAALLNAQLADARLAALQTQLNPHFLFNTLNAISTLVERDPRGVRRMIARLSELLRYSLAGAADQEVPLRREIDFVERYLEIMQLRYQGRLGVDMEIAPEVDEALVPTLVLQTLVENALKHGVDRMKEGGRISIVARREGEQVLVQVRDNGPGVVDGDEVPEDGGGVGLRNARARLSQLYGDGQRLTLRPAPGGGTIAEIVVPYHTTADLRTIGSGNDS